MSFKHALFCLSLISFTSLQAWSHTNKDNCASGPRTNRVTARHIEGKGIGYKDGYTTLEGFFSPQRYTEFLPFLDLRGHLFDNGKWAANAGAGLRYLQSGSNTIFGINAYYDYRRDKGHNFNQASVGLEALQRIWEFRINGYLPVGKKLSNSFSTQFSNFQGNNIYLKSKRDFALKGIDAEGGGHFYRKRNVDLYAGIGPYVFKGHYGKTAVGGKARITARALDYFMVEVSGSYDQVFHGIVQGQFGITIPFGPKMTSRHADRTHYYTSCEKEYELEERWVQPVERQEIVVLDRHTSKQIAINPATGLPYNVIFVNNLSSSNGTFESPYSTLATAQTASKPYDVIYIFPGDGTVRGLGTGFTMQAGQKLFGSGIDQSIATQVGTITIPALTDQLPIITNVINSDTVVMLDTQTEIAGLRIYDVSLPSVNRCIYATGAVTNVLIRDNVLQLQDSGYPIIDFTPATGNLTQSASIINNVFSGSAYEIGIQFATPSTALNVVQNFFISGNQIQGFSNDGVNIFALGLNDASTKTGQIVNNTFSGYNDLGTSSSATGLNFTCHDHSNFNILVSNNIIENCDTTACVLDTALGSTLTIVMDSNQLLGNNNNVNVVNFGIVDTSTLNCTFTNNFVSGYSAFQGSLTGGGGQLPSFAFLDVSNNTFDTSDETAVVVSLSAEAGPPTSAICMQINNNTTRQVSTTPPATYTLNNANVGNTFNLETPIGNTGTFSTTDVTIVPVGTCFPVVK